MPLPIATIGSRSSMYKEQNVHKADGGVMSWVSAKEEPCMCQVEKKLVNEIARNI